MKIWNKIVPTWAVWFVIIIALLLVVIKLAFGIV